MRSVATSRSSVATSPRQPAAGLVRRASIQERLPLESEISQVGYLDDYGTGGPMGMVHGEPGCGMEVTCGMEFCSGCDSCGGYVEPGCGCDGGCDGGCEAYCDVDSFPLFLPILRIDWNRFSFFAGSQAFKGPLNYPNINSSSGRRGGSGSFGYYQGFNEGRNLRPWIGADISAQFGLRATQTNLEGEEFTDASRKQIFVSGGFFRRVDYGLQYGLVVDYLNDEWYYNADLVQLRGELSWKVSPCHEFGFQFMNGVNDATLFTTVTNVAGQTVNDEVGVEAIDQYRGFYRRTIGTSGSWTVFLGGTDREHVLFGSEMEIPLQAKWSLAVGSTYFSPGSDSDLDGNEAEAWNVSLGVVFRPGMGHPSNRYRRPMFNVADNGSFLTFTK